MNFPFSTLRSDMRLTLKILFYVNVGVAWFVIKIMQLVSQWCCVREWNTQKLVLSTESTQVNWPPWRAYVSRANLSLLVSVIQHFILRPICKKIQSNPALRTPAEYGHLIYITDSLLCPWGKKTLTFSLKSTHLIGTSHYYYGQFAVSLGKENPYIFSKVNPLNTDTSLLLRTVCCVPGNRKPLHFL